MKPMEKFKGAMGDVKSRTLIIFTGFIIIVAIGIVFTSLKHKAQPESSTTEGSYAARLKQQRTTGQLGVADKEYNELQRRQNKEVATAAMQEGGAAVPTLVGDQLSQLDTAVLSIDQGAQTPQSAEKARQEAAAEYQRKMAEEAQAAADKLAAEEAVKRNAQVSASENQKQSAFEGLMTTQATALFKLWQPPTQAYKSGAQLVTITPAVQNNAKTPGAAGAPIKGAGSNEAADAASAPVVLKAGEIMFGILETAVNSDEPGPVMATIVSGPLVGSKVIGSMGIAGPNSEKATLTFSVLNAPSLNKSVGISAVAIDPETSRTAVASDVDHHYLLRYGSMLGGAFLQGMSSAVTAGIQNPGLTVAPGTSGAVAPTPINVTTKDQIITGLGAMGQQIGTDVNIMTRPATIKVASGTSIGLLLLQDLSFAQPAGTVAAIGSPTPGPVTTAEANAQFAAALKQTGVTGLQPAPAPVTPTGPKY